MPATLPFPCASQLALRSGNQAARDWVATLVTMSATAVSFALTLGPAVGIQLVLVLAVHEFGHLASAWRQGLAVRSPLFVPFLGAFVRLAQEPPDAAAEARFALAGPLTGGCVAIAAGFLGLRGENQALLSFGQLGIVVNLLNLLPLSPLDGGRALEATSRWPNLLGVFLAVVLMLTTGDYTFIAFLALGLGMLYFRFQDSNASYYRISGASRVRIVLQWFAISGGLGLAWFLL